MKFIRSRIIFAVLVLIYYSAVLLVLRIGQERHEAGRVYGVETIPADIWEAVPGRVRDENTAAAALETASAAASRETGDPDHKTAGTSVHPDRHHNGFSGNAADTSKSTGTSCRTNPDYAGELEIPALSLRYPFVRSSDNTEYLSRLIDGTENRAGCIFMDMAARPDLRGANTILFGHNMRDGSMFGRLRLFSQDFSLAAEQPYIYIRTDEEVLTYRIFLFATVRTDDADAYAIPQTREEYDRFIGHMRGVSAWMDTEAVQQVQDNRPCVLTLSTCWGDSHKENFVVLAGLEERF